MKKVLLLAMALVFIGCATGTPRWVKKVPRDDENIYFVGVGESAFDYQDAMSIAFHDALNQVNFYLIDQGIGSEGKMNELPEVKRVEQYFEEEEGFFIGYTLVSVRKSAVLELQLEELPFD